MIIDLLVRYCLSLLWCSLSLFLDEGYVATYMNCVFTGVVVLSDGHVSPRRFVFPRLFELCVDWLSFPTNASFEDV